MNRLATALVLLCFFVPGPVAADVLQVPAAQAFQNDLRGMTMEAVRKQFGEPRQVLPPVGDPPITRWVYDDMTVYFERDRVIHAVRHPGSHR